LEWLWTTGAALATALALAGCVVADLAQGGLGTSNGRVVSFLNSLNAAASYRRQRRVLRTPVDRSHSPNSERRRSELLYLRSSRHSWAHRVKLFSLMFLAKFGSGSVGSVMLGATPVILKGPRHMASWLFAFACIQLCPRDSVYCKLQDNAAVLLVVRLGCALYKLRKFNFVADFALLRHHSLSWLLLTQIVVIDGNNLCSRVSTWGWLRGLRKTSGSDLLTGAVALAQRIVPIILASALYFFSCGASPSRGGQHWVVLVVVKLVVFLVFLLRYDVHKLALRTWDGLGAVSLQRGGGVVAKNDDDPDDDHDDAPQKPDNTRHRTNNTIRRSSSWQHLAAGGLAQDHAKAD